MITTEFYRFSKSEKQKHAVIACHLKKLFFNYFFQMPLLVNAGLMTLNETAGAAVTV
jgi:hypothetical protein